MMALISKYSIAFLIGVFAVFIALLFILEDTYVINIKTEIETDRMSLFNFLLDVKNYKLVHPQLREITVSEGSNCITDGCKKVSHCKETLNLFGIDQDISFTSNMTIVKVGYQLDTRINDGMVNVHQSFKIHDSSRQGFVVLEDSLQGLSKWGLKYVAQSKSQSIHEVMNDNIKVHFSKKQSK